MSEATPLVEKLIRAAEQNNLPGVKEALAEGANINGTEWKSTALLQAIRNHHQEMAEYLLDQGADIEKGDARGDTPLITAICVEDENIAKMLLDRGAKINARNKDKRTSANFAFDHLPTLKVLLERNPDINTPDSQGQTALIHAAKGKHLVAIRLLLDHSPDFTRKDKDGKTALDYITDSEELEDFKQLFEDAASGCRPLNDFKHILLGRELVNAAWKGEIEEAKDLLQQGADINTVSQGVTALYRAVANGDLEMTDFLLSNGADIEERHTLGTPLTTATNHRQPQMIRFLVSKGANLYPQSKDGHTPLYFGCCYPEIARTLLECGTNPDRWSDDPGSVPLVDAINMSLWETAAVLIKGGANVNLKGENGDTPLIAAAIMNPELIDPLIKAGADIYGTQCAFDRMDPPVARYLKEEILRREEEAVRTGLTEDISAPKRIRVKKGGMQP